MTGSSDVYPSVDKLDLGARKVCEAAVAMVEQSYAPYSKFRYEEEIEWVCFARLQIISNLIILQSGCCHRDQLRQNHHGVQRRERQLRARYLRRADGVREGCVGGKGAVDLNESLYYKCEANLQDDHGCQTLHFVGSLALLQTLCISCQICSFPSIIAQTV